MSLFFTSDDGAGYRSSLRIDFDDPATADESTVDEIVRRRGVVGSGSDDLPVSDGVVRIWSEEEGWGVIDTDSAPGGCWTHYSAVEMDGFRTLRPGRRVRLTVEPVQDQDGYRFRAVRVHPLD